MIGAVVFALFEQAERDLGLMVFGSVGVAWVWARISLRRERGRR